MTEADWQTCTEPGPMLDLLQSQQRVSERKFRLFGCACCRRIWHLLFHPASREAVEVAERYADGLANRAQLQAAFDQADHAAYLAVTDPEPNEPDPFDLPGINITVAEDAAYAAYALVEVYVEDMKSQAISACVDARDAALGMGNKDEGRHQMDLLRDIFGNPFRPVLAPEPAVLAWSDRLVVRLAESIYEQRAFDRLPILADALEEAGCADEVILTHLRGSTLHVPGCWALDLLLGKS
jgi:hypothetical protein